MYKSCRITRESQKRGLYIPSDEDKARSKDAKAVLEETSRDCQLKYTEKKFDLELHKKTNYPAKSH